LVDVMVVVAIIGVLVAIALPTYQNYVVRTRVSEGVLAASPCRTAIAVLYQASSPANAPESNGWGCESPTPQATKYVETVTTDDNGVVTVFLSMAPELKGAAHHTITFTPVSRTGAPLTIADMPAHVSQFKCQSGGFFPIPPKYLPSSCQ
jgi:type IV pilus assembly protein PilA